MFSNTHLFRPKPSPIKKKTPFIIAIRDIKTNNIAPTLTAILTPSAVPEESAPIKLLPILSAGMVIFSVIFSVCGYIIFAITTAPGAAITDAASKLLAKANRSIGSSPPRKPI